MRVLISSIVLLFAIITSRGEKPLPYMYHVTFDLEKTEICGLNFDEFEILYAANNNKPENYLGIWLKQQANHFEKDFNDVETVGTINKNLHPSVKCVLLFEQISEKGGMKGKMEFRDSAGTLVMNIPFDCPDGRWNKFENLFSERLQTVAKDLREKFQNRKTNFPILCKTEYTLKIYRYYKASNDWRLGETKSYFDIPESQANKIKTEFEELGAGKLRVDITKQLF